MRCQLGCCLVGGSGRLPPGLVHENYGVTIIMLFCQYNTSIYNCFAVNVEHGVLTTSIGRTAAGPAANGPNLQARTHRRRALCYIRLDHENAAFP